MLNAGILLSLALLAGRLAGLLRELLLASMFGVSAEADIAVLLLSVPDLFVNLLVSGGLTAALVPHLSSLDKQGAMVLWRQATVAAALLFGVIGASLVAWPQGLFQLLAPGVTLPFGPGSAMLVAIAAAVTLTGAAGVAGAYLNANGRYGVTGSGTLIFNLVVLAALWMGSGSSDPLAWLAGGVAAGALVRWFAQLLTVPARAWVARTSAPVADRALARAFVTAAMAAAMMLLAPLLVRALASLIGTGAIASFNYAQKLVELPVGILITSVSTISLTRLSGLYAQNDARGLATSALKDTQYALLMGVSVALLGCWFADAVVHVLFGRGEMDSAALARVAGLTRIALVGVPLVALSSMAMARLNATRRTAELLKPTMGALALLPILALPGLYWSSEVALMGAVVAFQAVLAIWLSVLAGLRLFGAGALLAPAAVPFFGAVASAGVLAAVLDSALDMRQQWLRLALAGACFGLALLPMRRFLRSNSDQPTLAT